MNTTTTMFLRSEPSMYMTHGRTYARVGVRDPARMYTYVAVFSFLHPGRCTYVYVLVGSRTPTRGYVRPGLMYMAGSERRNIVVVVFMGSQPAGSERNASSCSSGGLGRNSQWKRGLAYRRTEETALCSTDHVRNGILFIGRGLAYRKMKETDLLRSKWRSY